MAAAIRYLAIVSLVLWGALTSLATAQEQQQPDYTAWEKLASQAEQIIESGQANDARLDAIRAEVVKWRENFKAAEGTNATRIATLRDQIAALGPVPAEGASESDEVAARRKALNEQLAELQAPGLNAVEAYGRADGIVQQIDRAQRERQANALLRQYSSPLNPANWGAALQEGYAFVRGISDEFRAGFDAQGRWTAVRQWGPGVAIVLVAALLLLTWGQRWVTALPSRLSVRTSDRIRAVTVFAVSLGQIVIPLVGVLLALFAIMLTGLPDRWGMPLLRAVPGGALLIFSGIWLAGRVFPTPGSEGGEPLPLTESLARKARFNTSALVAVLAVWQIVSHTLLPNSRLSNVIDPENRVPMTFSDEAAAVWYFPLIVLGAYFMFRLGNILRNLTLHTPPEELSYRLRIGAGAGIVSRYVAVVSVALVVLGYVALANALIWPWVITLGLIGLLILMQDFIADLYAMAKGGGQKDRDSLIPLAFGLMLTLGSVPLFLLTWGMRPAELAEYWTQILQGFRIGGVSLSPSGIITFIVIFMIGYSLTRFIQGALRSTVLPRTSMDIGGQNAVVVGIGYLGIFVAGLLAITSAGIDLTSLAVIAGALSVGIGFGLQNIVSNFVSGIILLIERPIKEGDWIDVGGKQGTVRQISVRSTHIQTFDRTIIVVPNSDLVQQPVTNWTQNNLTGRIIVPITVALGSDSREVERILREIAEDQPTVLINPPPTVLFRGFGPNGMNFEIRAIVADIFGGLGATSEINHDITRRFAEAGIEIPVAQHDLWLRNRDLPEGAQSGEGQPPPGGNMAPEHEGQAQAPSGREVQDDAQSPAPVGYGADLERR